MSLVALGLLALVLGAGQMLALQHIADRLCLQPGSARGLVVLTAAQRLLAALLLAAALIWLGPIPALALLATAWAGRTTMLLIATRR